MNDMLVGILGLAAIAATVISLTRGKMLPAMAFILWPSVLALAMVAAGRCNLSDIEAMLMAGFGSTAPTAAMHKKIITRHAGPALLVCTTMMDAAVFMGIMTSSIGSGGEVLPSSMIELPPDAVPSVMRCLANLISNALRPHWESIFTCCYARWLCRWPCPLIQTAISTECCRSCSASDRLSVWRPCPSQLPCRFCD